MKFKHCEMASSRKQIQVTFCAIKTVVTLTDENAVIFKKMKIYKYFHHGCGIILPPRLLYREIDYIVHRHPWIITGTDVCALDICIYWECHVVILQKDLFEKIEMYSSNILIDQEQSLLILFTALKKVQTWERLCNFSVH